MAFPVPPPRRAGLDAKTPGCRRRGAANMVGYLESGKRHGTVYMFLRICSAIEKEEQRRANARTLS